MENKLFCAILCVALHNNSIKHFWCSILKKADSVGGWRVQTCFLIMQFCRNLDNRIFSITTLSMIDSHENSNKGQVKVFTGKYKCGLIFELSEYFF